MKKYAIVSYNLYANFTNYGSALQQYALFKAVNKISPNKVKAIILDYCPIVLNNLDVLDPIKNMWDSDDESKKMIRLTMPAIEINYKKFKRFFREEYELSKYSYTSSNFNESFETEKLDGYICGSDTIWSIKEFGGYEDGYYGNYHVMRNSNTISYAASFGDDTFEGEEQIRLIEKLKNFKAIGVRENTNLTLIKNSFPNMLAQRVLDPTLLFEGKDYESIIAEKQLDEPYILLYSRRYNKNMEDFTINLSKQLGYKVVEISLRATNSDKHIMRYDAGVEEFLSLVKHAEYVITNSFHGAIFAILMHRKFFVFSRQECDTKIDELLSLLNLKERKLISGLEIVSDEIDYGGVDKILSDKRKDSLNYLKRALLIE